MPDLCVYDTKEFSEMKKSVPFKELSDSDLNVRGHDRVEEAPTKRTKTQENQVSSSPLLTTLDSLKLKFPKISHELLVEITRNDFFAPLISGLFEIDDSEIFEDDPYLLVVPDDLTNGDSIGYWNSGNFGLAPGSPGFRPWPGK